MNAHKVKSIVKSLSNINSDNFFNEICLSLSRTIDADFVFIATIDKDKTRATAIAFAHQGVMEANFNYSLNDTPCSKVINEEVCAHQCHIQQLYPKDSILIDMNIEGYVGVPLKNNKGDVSAILVALFEESIDDMNEVETLFLLFSGLIEKELHKSSYLKTIEFSRDIIENTQEAIMVCDKSKLITYINPSFTRLTGYSIADIKGKTPRILSSDRQDKAFYQAMWADVYEKGHWQGKIWNTHKSGREYLEYLSISAIVNKHKEVTHYNAFFSDITEQYKAQKQVEFQDYFDTLTKIANKKMLIEFIDGSLIHHARQPKKNTSAALFVIDIDLFKRFNSLYGHIIGDKILINVASRLKSLVRGSDIVARTSGDNFALFVNDLPNQDAINHILNNITQEFSTPFNLDDIHIKLTLSIGIAYFRQDALDAQGLFEKAEQAMFVAKDNGRNSYSFYSKDISDKDKQQELLKIALELAIQQKDFSVVYQPIVSLKQKNVTKFEALVRWNYNGNWVSPVDFIPLAEKFGLINKIGDIVLNKSCDVLKKLHEQGFKNIVFSINRSIYELPLKNEIENPWLNTIKAYGLPPQSICFELTESVLAPENDSHIALLNELQLAGCEIALDDFGTGYSSLSYLRRFSIDILKIDRSFIKEMTKVKGDVLLVSAIVSMAKALNISVIAEGVERKKEVDILNKLGCDYIQGYYFSKPMLPEQLNLYLTNFQYVD